MHQRTFCVWELAAAWHRAQVSYAFWRDEAACLGFIAGLGLTFLAINESAAREAGPIFASYRQSGGPREYLVPDFLVAAHARRQSDQFVVVDRGYLRAYFAQLRMLNAWRRRAAQSGLPLEF